MKANRNILRLRENLLVIVLSIVFGIAFISPQLTHTYPSLLDIAETVNYKSNSLANISSYIVEPNRFWPLHYLVRIPLSRACGYIGRCYFEVYGVMVGFTILTTLTLSKRKLLVFPIVACYFISPITVDSFWRLGVSETILGICLVLSLVLYIRRYYFFLFVTLLLGCLTKETFIYYLPVFIYALWVDHKRGYLLAVSVLFITYACMLFPRLFLALSTHGSYPSSLVVSPAHGFVIGKIFWQYVSQFVPFMLSMIVLVVYVVRNKLANHREFLVPTLLLLFGLIPIFTIQNIQAYYLLPTFLVSMCLLIVSFNDVAESNKLTSMIFFAILVCCTTPFSFGATLGRMQYWKADYVGDDALISWLQSHAQSYVGYYLDGRSEYQEALVYLLNDNQFTGNTSLQFSCSSTLDGRGTQCIRENKNAVQKYVTITGNSQSTGATNVCSPQGLLYEKTCKWHVSVE